MKLSMWILLDYLREFSPIAYIRDGRRVLSNARILSEASFNTTSNVYLDRAADYIDGARDDRVICVHGQDMIILETADINAVFNRILDCFDYYNVWEDTCRTAIQNSGSLSQIIELSSPFFSEYLSVSDETDFVLDWHQCFSPEAVGEEIRKDIQYWESIRERKALTPKTVMDVRRQSGPLLKRGIYTINPPGGYRPSTVRRLFYENTHWGFLVESNLFSMPSPAKEQHLDILGEMIELWLQDEQNRQTTEKHFRDVFREVFSHRTEEAVILLQQHLSNLLWSTQCRKRFFCIQNRTEISVLPTLSQTLNRNKGCVAGVVGSLAYVLCNLDALEEKSFLAEFKHLLEDTESRAGSSYAFTDLADILSQEKVSTVALAYAERSKEILISAEEYVLPYLKDIVDHHAEIDICHPAVRLLEEYDAEHETQLTETLYVFLLCHQNYARTGERLFLHRNTVQYRVEKAIELAEIDLDNEKTYLHLLISLCLRYMKFS